MKLITNLHEVQRHIPVQMTNAIETVRPFISSAERAHVLQLIGRDQYQVLVNTYQAALEAKKQLEPDTLKENSKTEGKPVISFIEDPILREAVEFCQKIETALGYYNAIPVLAVKIGSSGIQVVSTADTKQAFNWQVDDLKKSLLNTGYDAIEDLLALMDESPDIFPEYFGSDQYQVSQEYLIESAKEFSRYFNIGSKRYIFQSFAYIMRRIESQKISKLYGADFFQHLKEDNLQGKAKILANEFIKPGIALLTAAKAITERVITFENGVASINLIGNYDSAKTNIQASKDDIFAATTQLNTDAEKFLQDGLLYLKQNAIDFPEYKPSAPRASYNIRNNRDGGIYAL